jgi:hypothetical protein
MPRLTRRFAIGIGLPQVLAAGAVVYGRSFNPLITLKALCYFDDVPSLPAEIQERCGRRSRQSIRQV